MATRMLIDATHAEETRVVVLNGSRLEEFDVETSTKKQLKGNIYLAKIVRVEPSLQAAFVDYGGGRHGFLAFNEIHPDYYQIPVADRQALMAEQRDVMRESSVVANAADFGDGDDVPPAPPPAAEAEGEHGEHPGHGEHPEHAEAPEGETVEAVGGDEAEGEAPRRPRSLRHYKIQEVIKRRQIVLVQVVKEERGTKGAALTTYLSLAGRYCVLMPNTARGGGVSRKITNAADRKRLKVIANELEIPEGMAVIVRTAGSERTKPEIKRDYEYLLRLWDSVRELTLRSTAPTLVYEEANLIKRSIRDLYSRDIDEILVEGDEGYRLAKDFMRMLTPSHAKKVQLYKEPGMPLFQRFQVESQLDAMHSPVVQLKSGGYIVLNQTEALVAIDVNSGRSTRERHIEETALKTNIEAADEVARQLRLRDLAGLIVIDFIDMEDSRNNHAVERRLKDAMRSDRARIQLGKISAFGLLELSRQRLRPSLMESSFQTCVHCGGAGVVRSTESSAVHVLRAIEEDGMRRHGGEIHVSVQPQVALYVLNQKRSVLSDIESRYGLRVYMLGDDSLVPPAHRIDRVKSEAPVAVAHAQPVHMESTQVEEPLEEVEDAAEADEADGHEAPPHQARAASDEGEGPGRRRRRRRRRGRRDEFAAHGGEIEAADEAAPAGDGEDHGEEHPTQEESPIAVAEGEPARRRRRGKRGGRRRNRGRDGAMLPQLDLAVATQEDLEHHAAEESEAAAQTVTEAVAEMAPEAPADAAEPAAETPPAATPKRGRSRRRAAAAGDGEAPVAAAAPAPEPAAAEAAPTAGETEPPAAARPRRTRKPKAAAEPRAAEPVQAPREPALAEAVEEAEDAAPPATVTAAPPAEPEPAFASAPEPVAAEPAAPAEPPAPPRPARKGWWNRLL